MANRNKLTVSKEPYHPGILVHLRNTWIIVIVYIHNVFHGYLSSAVIIYTHVVIVLVTGGGIERQPKRNERLPKTL